MGTVFIVMERAERDANDSATETPWRFDSPQEAETECERLNAAKADEHPGYFVQETRV